MRSIFAVLSLLILVSCSTPFHEKYSCKPLKDKNYEYCTEKKGKLIGYRHVKDGWILEPKILYTRHYGDSKLTYLKEEGAEFYSVVTLGSGKKPELTPFVSLITSDFNYDKFVDTIVVGMKKDRTFQTLDHSTGKPLDEHPNLDFNINNEYGATIPTLVANFLPGYWVRQKEDGKRVYRFVTKDGKIEGEAIPEGKVRFHLSDGILIPFELVDETRQLYWPLIRFSDGNLKRPKEVKGLALPEWKHWEDPILGGTHRPRIPTSNYLLFIYDEGKREVAYSKSFSAKNFKRGGDVQKYFSEYNSGGRAYYDFTRMKRQKVSSKGKIYETTDYLLTTDTGIHVAFGDSAAWDQNFSSREDLVTYLETRGKNINEERQKVVDKNARDAAEGMRIRAEIAEQVRQDTQRLKDERANIREAQRARDKAASNAAWQGVSNQLQNRGREASKKADCINKRTTIRKKFLDKKQGWYQEGGC